MKKTTIAIAVLSSVFAVSAMADGHDGHDRHEGQEHYSWNAWVHIASASPEATEVETDNDVDRPEVPISAVPTGTANYSGSTLAAVTDSSSGTAVRSISTGAVNLAVTFDGTANTTETGTITGLTGTGGAAIGDLAFTATGQNREFQGTVTSTTYPSVAATATAPATGTGAVHGELSAPVVVSPAVAATATSPAVPAVIAAPQSANGSWHFVATSTLSAYGRFMTVKQ